MAVHIDNIDTTKNDISKFEHLTHSKSLCYDFTIF